MIEIILMIVFIIAGAFFNAVMDTVENENFFESRLKNLPQSFWYKRESWRRKKFFGYRFDAWHISKTLMLTCIVVAAILFKASPLPLNHAWDVVFYVVWAGILWSASFTLFYHVILKVK